MIDIQSGLHNVLESKKKQFPSHVNRISALDDPCLRRLYYSRVAWDKATPTDDKLQGIFESGNLLEPVIERIVLEVGMASFPRWRIVGKQLPTNDALLKKYQISGTIDGLLQVEIDTDYGMRDWNTVGVVDIKTCSGNIYPTINCYDDLARYPWTKKYRGQLQLYALAHNVDKCFILFVNKQSLYEMKFIEFDLDMDYCESLLRKADIVNGAIENLDPPDGVDDNKICSACKFLSHCAPDLTIGKDLKISTDVELERQLERMQDLEPGAKEYAVLKKLVDNQLTKGQNIACGRFMITWKEGIRRYKAQPAKEAYEIETWTKDIFVELNKEKQNG